MEEDNQTITTPQLGQGQPTTFRQYIKSLHNNRFRKDELKRIFSQGPIVKDPRTNEAYTNPLNLLGDTMDTINDQVRLGGYSLKDLGYDAMDFVEEKTTEHIDTGYPALDKVIVGGAVIGTALLTPDATDVFLPGGADLVKLAKRTDIFKSAGKFANQVVNTNWVGKLNKLTEPKLAVAGGGSISNDVQSTILKSVDRTVFKTTSSTYKGLPELAPAYSKAKKAQAEIAKKALLEGKPRPAFWNPETQSIWKFESKGKGSWSAFNTDNKLVRVAKRMNLAKGKYITLDDMVKELGPELGQKAFEINETKLKKLYRWVSKEGAQLDHISPVSKKEGGYLVWTNLILLRAKDNIAKGNKVLPKALLDELGVPLTKEAAIRSILNPTSTLTPKQKRVKILRELGIWKEVK